MLDYHEYENKVYEWLKFKHEADKTFTFSLRQKGTKAARTDRFIGTKKGGYFGTTFWSIPVSYPGASADFIDLFFFQNKKGYHYYFEFQQTNNPDPGQNSLVLSLHKALHDQLSRKFKIEAYSGEEKKMNIFKIHGLENTYHELDDMLQELDNRLPIIIEIVNNTIDSEKKKNTDLKAERIRISDFQEMERKLDKRIKKYRQQIIDYDFDEKWLELKESVKKQNNDDAVNKFFDCINYVYNSLDMELMDDIVYCSCAQNGIQFTMGSVYLINLKKKNNKLRIGFYIPGSFLDQIRKKYELLIDEKEFEDKQQEDFTWIYVEADKVDISDFKSALTERANFVYQNQSKSNFRATWEALFNKWIPIAATDLKIREKLFDNKTSSYGNVWVEKSITKNRIITMDKLEPMNNPLNTILYGPPGTGKTYKLKTHYFPKYTSSNEEVSREARIQEVLKNLTWWQVIAIVLLDLKEAKAKDIYNHELVKLKEKLTTSKNVDSTIRGKLQAHTVDSCEIVNTTRKLMPLIFYKEQGAIWKLDQEGFEEVQEDINELAELCKADKINKASEVKRYEFVTFHQSYAYEDFIEGIKPVMETEGNGELSYEIKDGLFKTLCIRAKNDPENKYAIFIDEINRGNVSSIFGELITLIEPDKRLGMENAMTATLPYSRESFGVPSNVDIYGTMNTADRSVEALDTALRRRFAFEEMMPKADDLSDNMEGISLKDILECINNRIEALIDRDHTIGHSYLINVRNMDDLRLAFKDKIIPLLQEYFYGDYGKIGLVLGSGFVKIQTQDNEIFADFEYEGSDGLAQNKFELISFEDKDFNFEKAIETLLNNSGE